MKGSIRYDRLNARANDIHQTGQTELDFAATTAPKTGRRCFGNLVLKVSRWPTPSNRATGMCCFSHDAGWQIMIVAKCAFIKRIITDDNPSPTLSALHP
jgi:hypothetical protein